MKIEKYGGRLLEIFCSLGFIAMTIEYGATTLFSKIPSGDVVWIFIYIIGIFAGAFLDTKCN